MKNNDNIDKQLDAFLDSVLKAEPKCNLSSEFAENVKSKVYNTFVWKHYLKEFFISYAVGIVVLILAFAILSFTNAAYLENIIAYIITYKRIFIIALTVSMVLLFYNHILLNFMLYYYKNKLSKE